MECMQEFIPWKCKFIRIEAMCQRNWLYLLVGPVVLAPVSKSRTHSFHPTYPTLELTMYTRWSWYTQHAHILNLFKINWIHRTGSRLCMIAYESFPNVFTTCVLSILSIWSVYRFSSVVIVWQPGNWAVKWCHELNMQHITVFKEKSMKAFYERTEIERERAREREMYRQFSDINNFAFRTNISTKSYSNLTQLMNFWMVEPWIMPKNWK